MRQKTFILVLLFFLSNVHMAFCLEGSDFYINPIYKNLISQDQRQIKTSLSKSLRTDTCLSYESFKETVKNKYFQRATPFKIILKYDFYFSNIKNIIDNVHEEIMSEDDYLRFSYTSRSNKWTGYDGNVTITFTMQYLTTAEQEQHVNDRVTEILGQIITQDMNFEEIEKVIHDWVVSNVQYDTSYQEHSAYAALFLGKTVCQGYALLMYKMLTEAGMESRIVDGTVEKGSHAWNMVNLCGTWFHVDATWDDPVPDEPGRVLYNYYNLSDTQMEADHYWDNLNYPSASFDYVEGEICANTFTIEGRVITDLPGYEVGIKNAQVQLFGKNMSTITDLDGDFSLTKVPEIDDTYLLKISAPNFKSYTQLLTSVPSRIDIGIISLDIGVMAGTYSQEELNLEISQAVEEKNYLIEEKTQELENLSNEYQALSQTYNTLFDDYRQLSTQNSDLIDNFNNVNNWISIFDIHNDRKIGIHEAINALKCASEMDQ